MIRRARKTGRTLCFTILSRFGESVNCDLETQFGTFLCRQLQADPDRTVHFSHHCAVYVADIFFQALFVDCPDLFQQYDGILYDSVVSRADLNMCGEFRLVHPRCNRRADHSRAVPVPDIVLYDEHRAYSSLFRSHNRT